MKAQSLNSKGVTQKWQQFNGRLEAHYKKRLDIVKKQRDNMRF